MATIAALAPATRKKVSIAATEPSACTIGRSQTIHPAIIIPKITAYKSPLLSPDTLIFFIFFTHSIANVLCVCLDAAVPAMVVTVEIPTSSVRLFASHFASNGIFLLAIWRSTCLALCFHKDAAAFSAILGNNFPGTFFNVPPDNKKHPKFVIAPQNASTAATFQLISLPLMQSFDMSDSRLARPPPILQIAIPRMPPVATAASTAKPAAAPERASTSAPAATLSPLIAAVIAPETAPTTAPMMQLRNSPSGSAFFTGSFVQ